MAKRRTRKQKEATKQHYQLPKGLQTTLPATSTQGNEAAVGVKSVEAGLYAYDPGLITQDIRKSMFISGIVLALQLGLFFWLR